MKIKVALFVFILAFVLTLAKIKQSGRITKKAHYISKGDDSVLKPKEIAYTKTIRIGGFPLLNPFKTLEELQKWLVETQQAFPAITWRMEEWSGEPQLCI